MEKICKKHGLTEYSNSIKSRCKKCMVEAVIRRRKKLKSLAVQYKGGKCQKCGYDKCIAALEFHHIDPKEKDFSISDTGSTRSWEKIKLELDKCQLLCSNCHKEIHLLG